RHRALTVPWCLPTGEMRVRRFIGSLLLVSACHPTPSSRPSPSASEQPTLARLYYWRAKPGKLDEYSQYIREYAEPIDREAQRHGAFVSITTTAATDSLAGWTHLRVFRLRDSAQLAGLSAALDHAGVALVPDSVT